MKYTLYLASDSASRKGLLTEAQIPFQIISHTADESVVDVNKPLSEVVTEIAELKMNHVIVPAGTSEGQIVFVLTADTLTLKGGPGAYEVFGKPRDRAHAEYMLKVTRQGSITGTAFCLQKLVFKDGSWHSLDRQTGYAQGFNIIDIPDEFIDFYLDRIDFLNVSGAIKIRGLCEQFVKEIRGSYSAIMGMPMYELRDMLYRMGFY